jgi:hypothetical protein
VLLKKFGNRIYESVVQEDLESTNIRVQGPQNSDPAASTRTPLNTLPQTHTSMYMWREGQRCSGCDHSPRSEILKCWWNRTWRQRALRNECAVSNSDTRSVTAEIHTVPQVWGFSTILWMPGTSGPASVLYLRL